MILNLTHKFAIFSIIFFAFLFIGCTTTNSEELDSEDLAYLNYLEKENKQLREDLKSKVSENSNENSKESINDNQESNEEDDELDELQIRYSMYKDSCDNTLRRTQEDLNNNDIDSYNDIENKLEMITFICDEQYESDFKKFEDSEDLLDEIENVINDLEFEEDRIEELKTSNCITEALDLEEEIEENNSNTNNLDYIKSLQRIKLDCEEDYKIDSNEFDEIIENINEKLENKNESTTNNELDALKEEIKDEIREELKKDEEDEIQSTNIQNCFSNIENSNSELNSNIFFIDINEEKNSIENIENVCEEYFEYNSSLKLEFENLENLFNQTKETISLTKHNSITIEENKKILGPSDPNLHGSNVTWLVNTSIYNLNETNDITIKNFRVWVARRDVIPVGNPMTIAEDPISNKTLNKNVNEITIEAGSSTYISFKFNYSDLPTPIVYTNYNGYEIID